ncbi:MAG: heavy-metal-associated domain-containing protein [Marmoricola sp.]
MTSTTYQVSGMTCGHCANAVTEEITAIDGVSTVSVDVESGQVIVTGEATAEQVAAAVSEAGYAVVS